LGSFPGSIGFKGAALLTARKAYGKARALMRPGCLIPAPGIPIKCRNFRSAAFSAGQREEW